MTEMVDYGIITTNEVNIRTVYDTDTTDFTNGNNAIMEDSGIKIEFLTGTAGEATTTHLPFSNSTSEYYQGGGWWTNTSTDPAHGFVVDDGSFPCIGSNISSNVYDEGYTNGLFGCHPEWLAFHPQQGSNNNANNTKLFIKVTPSTNITITGYTIYYQSTNIGTVGFETGQAGTSAGTHTSNTVLTGTGTTDPVGDWTYEGTVNGYTNVKKYTTTLTNNITGSDYLYIYIDDTADGLGSDAGTLKLLFNTVIITPTPITFMSDTLTIENSISATDTDAVSFVLPAGYEMADMSVTNFVGTGGTINYTIATSGAADITGTFTSTGTNLLTGNPLIASADTTYSLTLTADAAITYTIVGIKTVDYGIITTTNSALRQYPPDYVNGTSHVGTSTQSQNGTLDYAYTKGHQRKVVVSGQSYGNGDYYFTGVSHGNNAIRDNENAFIRGYVGGNFWYTDSRSTGTSTAVNNLSIYPNPNDGEGSNPLGDDAIAWQQIKMPTSIILQKVELWYESSASPTAELYIFGTNSETVTDSTELNLVFRSYSGNATRICRISNSTTYTWTTADTDSYLNNNTVPYNNYWLFVRSSNTTSTNAADGIFGFRELYLSGVEQSSVSTPTPITFMSDTLTIENRISATDTDAVSFVLPAGYEMADMSVTNFVGTGGTINYTIATSGAADITGTFTSTGTNLLTGNLLVASADTTYSLTLTADAAITYTIVGIKVVDYGGSPSPPIIHYTFDIDGTNIGSLGSSYDLNIASSFSLTTDAKFIGEKGLLCGPVGVGGGAEYWSTLKSVLTPAAYSFSYWAKGENVTKQSLLRQFLCRANQYAAPYLLLNIDGANSRIRIFSVDNWSSYGSYTPDLFDANWHHYVITGTTTHEVSVYIDSTLVLNHTFSQSLTGKSFADLYIGTSENHQLGWGGGYIDDFRMYDYILDTTAITTLYNNELDSPITFSNNVLTIENSISATDTDVVTFVLPAGYDISALNVVGFSGTGTIAYTIATSGAADITGTFTSKGTNLLTGNLLVAINTDTTYSLTLTADALISYSITGTNSFTMNSVIYSIAQLIAAGYTEQQLIDGNYWNADPNANRFDQTYMNGFVDISDGNVRVSDNILMDMGDIELNSFTYTKPNTFNADISLNNRLFVVGDVSMGDASLNIAGDISINGNMTVGSYKPASIPISAVGDLGYSTSGTTTTFTNDITYNNKIKFNGDITLNTYELVDPTLNSPNVFAASDAKTTTTGLSWQDIEISSTGQHQVAVVGGNTSTQVIATGNVWVSTDFGESWTEVTVGSGPQQWISAMVSGDGAVMMVKARGQVLYKSIDYGVTWTPMTITIPNKTYADNNNYGSSAQGMSSIWMKLAYDGLNLSTLYCNNPIDGGGSSSGSYYTFIRSTDGGNTWTETDSTYGKMCTFNASRNGQYIVIIYFDGTTKPKYSADFGETFYTLTNGPTNVYGQSNYQNAVCISNTGKICLELWDTTTIFHNFDVTTGTVSNGANDAVDTAVTMPEPSTGGSRFVINNSNDGKYILYYGHQQWGTIRPTVGYLSSDYGATFTFNTSNSPLYYAYNNSQFANRIWGAVFSDDNKYIAVVHENFFIYVHKATSIVENPNSTTYFGPTTTLNTNNAIEFPDSTTISSSNKEANGTTFKASTFNNMTVVGGFVSNPQLTPSDYRIKTNVETLDETHTVDNLRPVRYLQMQTGKNDIGFLAHELQEHYPELVEGEKDGTKMQSVNYMGLLPILINDVQQLKKQIAETRDRIRSVAP